MTAPVSVAFSADQARVAFTLFDRKGNILTAEMVAALRTGLQAVADNPHLRLITIQGQGSHFSYGASIPEHAPGVIEAVLPDMHALVMDLLEAPAVTAAVVRGRCLGGGFELALACDFIFAADDAEFGLPEIALGVFPPAASALLPRRIGAARATSAIVTGAPRPAIDWASQGLLELVCPHDRLEDEVDAWFARHLAGRSAAAIRHAAAAARLPMLEEVRRTLPQLERLYLDEVMRTADAAEGIAAFLERRPPRWTDA